MKSKDQNISPNRMAWKRLKRDPLAVFGMLFILSLLAIAILGPLVRPDQSPKANVQHLELARKHPGFQVEMLKIKNPNYKEQNFFDSWLFGWNTAFSYLPIDSYQKESKGLRVYRYTGEENEKGEELFFTYDQLFIRNEAEWVEKHRFILGTDRYGRDMLSRLMAGTWISFTVGIISIIISLVIGMSLGAAAGYFRGRFDDFVMWLINVVWSIPTLLLVIAITLALGKGFWQVFVAVGLTMWVEVARVVRGQVLAVREMEYIEAGKALGYSNFRIVLRHLIPNVTGPVIVISAANFAAAILIEAGLSFLGLGAQPPQATWGKMISEHKGYIITGDAYLALLPGVAIFFLVLSFVLLGNGLRDAFDAKSAKSLNV